MVKTIFKEIAIIILLAVAFVLLLGILFYNYMPTSKIIPSTVEEYAIDEDVKKELEKELNNNNTEEVVKTYLLDATDLAVYERNREYNKGKNNPFSQTPTSTGNSGSSGNSGGEGGSGGTDSSSNSGSSGSSGNNSNSDNSNSDSNANNNSSSNTNTNSNVPTGTYLNTVGK